jgi:hypothetical protein
VAYQTIRDLVAHVHSVHRSLRHAVRDAQSRIDDERSKLLLAVIDEHEAAIEHAVKTVEDRGQDAVLDTWLQFEPNAETERAIARSEPSSSMSSDAIVSHVLETENALMKLYELLRGSSGSPRVQEFFASLVALEDSAARRAARVGLEANDV